MKTDAEYLQLAIDQAKKSASEGGVPIGAVLVDKDGKVLGAGHNQRMQKKSATLHGEMDALENAGRLPGSAYKGATMYTTLSPCDMCTGACLMYGISRVVMGENKTFIGGENYLRQRGVEVVNLDNEECYQLMQDFIKEKPQEWNEDIGV
ncbi:cytosine deaminase [Trichomonascus vanleenenianus]|uniref:cytosine deaminase n=1 Tax=Trichomonascus vanleenenianus TaxID=2268995 RepID=UPI003EC99C6D